METKILKVVRQGDAHSGRYQVHEDNHFNK